MKLSFSTGTNALAALALMSFAGFALMDSMGRHEVEVWLVTLWLVAWLLLQITGLMAAYLLSSSLRNVFFMNISFLLLGVVSFAVSMLNELTMRH